MRSWGEFRFRGAGASLVIAGLAAWSLAPAGIIELGKKGQNKTGSRFEITANGVTVSDPNSLVGTSAFDILEGLRVQLVGLGFQAAHVDTDPNNPLNALSILAAGGVEPDDLRVFVEDSPSGLFGAASKVSGSLTGLPGPPLFVMKGIDQVNGDGNVLLDVLLQSGPLSISPISTNAPGATPQAKAGEVNKQIVAALRAEGLTVTPTSPGASGLIAIRSPSDKIASVGVEIDDTLARELSVVRAIETSGVVGAPRQVPALTEWGSLALVLALAGLALAVLRRRGRSARA